MNASRDQNHVPSLIGVSSADGVTIDKVKADPTNHGLQVNDGSTGSDHGTVDAQRDQNHTPALMAVSSIDGVTPVAIYTDGSGKLLVQST